MLGKNESFSYGGEVNTSRVDTRNDMHEGTDMMRFMFVENKSIVI